MPAKKSLGYVDSHYKLCRMFESSINDNSYNVPNSKFRFDPDDSTIMYYSISGERLIDLLLSNTKESQKIIKEFKKELTDIGIDMTDKYKQYLIKWKRTESLIKTTLKNIDKQTIKKNEKYFALSLFAEPIKGEKKLLEKV